MDPAQKLFTRIEIKAVNTDQRIIDGWAGAIGNKDRSGDIIDKGAFDRTLKERDDVVAFIGHDSSKLPVGEPISMRADADGLFTSTSVYNTPDGDALLEVARRRLARGKTLGMSIGYRTVKEKWVGSTRHLLDVDLVEYSFLASPDLAANPLATVTGVKATGTGPVITTDDSYEDLIDDLEAAAALALGAGYVYVCATFPDHVIVSTYSATDDGQVYYDFPYTLNADGEPELGEPTSVDPAYVPSDAKARATTRQEAKRMPTETRTVPWDAAFVSALPDSAFAFIEGGGTATKDESGSTVPRSLRHYPHHNPDGTVDAVHLEHALEHAASSPDDVGVKALAHLARHARAIVAGHAIDPHAQVWSEGAPAALLTIGYKLDKIIADIAQDRLAMERVGIDTKNGARLNSAMRARINDVHGSLGQILEWADQIEKGDDGKARVDMFRHRLAMLQLEEVS